MPKDGLFSEVCMRPLHRGHVNKRKSAKHFRHQSSRTKAPNVGPPPMRGGIRL